MASAAPQGFEQRTFETAVSSSASIVKPTVPKNVLAEFEHFAATGSRYKKANPFDEEDLPPSQPQFAEQPRRQAPPAPVQQPPQPPPQQQAPPRPVDFSQFGDFSVSRPAPTQAANSSQPMVQDDEKSRLVNAMQQHLRLKAAHGQAMTVGELSQQIRELTGQSWGAYWESKFGNLMVFLKNNPESFSVIRSKYVTCRGQEDVAMRQIDREAQEQSAMLAEQQRFQAQYSSVPIYAQQPPNTSAVQTSYYAPSFEDPFGLNQPSAAGQYGNEWGAPASEGYGSRSNSVVSRRDSNEWALPGSAGGANAFAPFDPFAPIDPFRAGEAPSFIPHANTSSLDWFASSQLPPQPPQPQQRTDTFNFSGFDDSLNTSKGLTPEEEEQIRKAERRASRKQKKQEEEDEALARELQNKEFEESSSRAAISDGDSGETVVLTTAQMRDLAEKELGIDNVRIIAGFTVKKYGREGRPHQRKMWVTQSLTHLAWASSLLEGSHRGIELKHVTEVTSGQMTPTISRTTSDRKKVQAQCFSLVTMSRTLDMQACSIIQRDALVNALRAVVAFNQKYKPEKVDRDLTRVRMVGYAGIFKGKN